jgi:hypothetical protein
MSGPIKFATDEKVEAFLASPAGAQALDVCRLISLGGYRRALLDVLTWRVCKLTYPVEMAREAQWVRSGGGT